MCFVNLFIYLSDIRERWLEEYLRYFMLCWVLILQERGPWQLHNTGSTPLKRIPSPPR
jgi:hypothetical protein